MWSLIVVHSKQVFHFNCVRFNKVPTVVTHPYYIHHTIGGSEC